ncbi:hypothetical protein [Sideroxydans sp.]
MNRYLLLFALVISFPASAVERSRCGTDQFGNIVCMDKDGVLSHVPRDYASEESLQSASGVSDAEKKRRAEVREKLRCGTDPFGNKVCR